jgi:hypothetical protein
MAATSDIAGHPVLQGYYSCLRCGGSSVPLACAVCPLVACCACWWCSRWQQVCALQCMYVSPVMVTPVYVRYTYACHQLLQPVAIMALASAGFHIMCATGHRHSSSNSRMQPPAAAAATAR